MRIARSLVVSLALSVFAPVTPANDLTTTEKAEVRRLLGIMQNILREDCPKGATFDAVLNPASEANSLACYETMPLRSGGTRPATLTDGYWAYMRLLDTNRICKVAQNSGGSTTSAKGIGADRVFIAGPQLTSALSNANPAQRAIDKFDIIATLANEMAHVFQKPNNSDPNRCEMERDSDCLMIKYLDGLISRLESAPGVPHTTTAGVAAEGSAGFTIAACLNRAGATSAASIAAVHRRMRIERAVAQDRKDNLFSVQIGQNKAWRTLYYGGRYKTRLALLLNAAGVTTTRQFTATYAGNSRVYTVPNDGKTIARIIRSYNQDSCIYLRVVTKGADGSVCMYTYTDTDKDGLPEIAGGTTNVFAPPVNNRPRRQANLDEIYAIEGVPNGLGFNTGFMLHDQANGRLVAYETLPNQIDLTGNSVELVDDPLYADPLLGDPAAGGFSQYVFDQIDPGLAQPVLLFSSDPNVGQTGQSPALIVPFDPFGVFPPFGPLPLADAMGPNANLGPEFFPADEFGQLTLHGPPFQPLQFTLLSEPLVPPLLVQPDQNGVAPPQPEPPLTTQGFLLLEEPFPGRSQGIFFPRLGQMGQVFPGDLNGDGQPDVIGLGTQPAAIMTWSDLPLPLPSPLPPINWATIAIEGIDPFDPDFAPVVIDPEELFLPGNPLDLGGPSSQPLPIFPILGTDPPLFAQSLHDFDASGPPDDAMVIAQLSQDEQWHLLIYNQGLTQPFPLFDIPLPLGFEPGLIEYPDLDGDSDEDVQIHGLFGGPPLCFENSLNGTLVLIPCQPPCLADTNGDGILDNGDILTFVTLFLAGDLAADMNGDGILDNGDILTFVTLFLAGC